MNNGKTLTKSEKNYLTKLDKIDKVVKEFILNDNITIIELAELTKVSKSAVQRYLNSPEVVELYGHEVAAFISERLKKQKQDGNSKGGKTTQKLYGYETVQNHRFNGSNLNVNKEIEELDEVIDLTSIPSKSR